MHIIQVNNIDFDSLNTEEDFLQESERLLDSIMIQIAECTAKDVSDGWEEFPEEKKKFIQITMKELDKQSIKEEIYQELKRVKNDHSNTSN